MIELLDNFSQLFVTLVATAGAGILFYKSRVQAYLLLTCFLVLLCWVHFIGPFIFFYLIIHLKFSMYQSLHGLPAICFY